MSEKREKKLNKKALTAIILCCAVVFGIVAYDFIVSQSKSEKTFIAMGTVINTKIYGTNGDGIQKQVEDEINMTESALLSWRIDGSEISQINANAGKPVYVSPAVSDVLCECVEVSSKTNGIFDITVGKVTKLWDFGGDNERLPDKEEIDDALSSVNYNRISVSGDSITIGENQSLDLGAVGKGYACDRVKALLDSTNAKSAVISVGGSLLLYGKKDFVIGIANPENDKEAMGTLKLKNTFVSTSGNYEKFFEKDGKKYHHILNAKTGYPAQSDLASVTVVCNSGLLSDALSTCCYILGYKNSLDLLSNFNAQAVFVYKDKSVKYTIGLEDSLEITNDEFKVSK